MRSHNNLAGRFRCREHVVVTERSILAFVEHRMDDRVAYRREVLGGRGNGRIGALGGSTNFRPETPHEPKVLGAAGGKNG